MIEPSVHIAYAPRGAGLLCALFWFAEREHVYGWYTGAADHSHPAQFFMLENYYAARDTNCYLSADNDVRGDWLEIEPGRSHMIDKPIPVPEVQCHELERLQQAFAQEWLFYASEPADSREADALHARELPVLAVNVRAAKLGKLVTDSPVWTYTTPEADQRVIEFLARHWSLDYAPD